MEVIATIDRTIDGIARKAGERFELPEDTDLIAKGVVSDPNAVAVVPEAPEHPIGWVGRVGKNTAATAKALDEWDAAPGPEGRRPLASTKSNAKRKPLA